MLSVVLLVRAFELSLLSPKTFCISPNINSEIIFEANENGTQSYTIENWDQKVIKTGEITAKDKQAKLTLNLPDGYYLIKVGKQTFGLFVAPKYQGKPDYFFGVDGAMSWLIPTTPNLREELIAVLAEHGVYSSRERIMNSLIFPEATNLDNPLEHAGHQYSQIRELYKKHNVKILDVSHDAPSWMKNNPDNPYPDDVISFAKATLKVNEMYGDNYLGWEVWNEPDLGFGGKLPAEYYMTLVKTVSYYWRKNNIKTPLVAAVVSELCHQNFRETMVKSEIADLVDAISIHNYSTWQVMTKMIHDYREALKNSNRPDLPIWVTEAGSHYEDDGYFSNLKGSHYSAAQNVLKAVESKAEGVEKYYMFVYASYFEFGRTFSMWAKNFSPMPELAAYLTLSKVLSNQDYLGSWNSLRVFGNKNNSHVIVIGRANEPIIQDANFIGIDGRQVKNSDAKTILDKDGMIYMFTTLDKIKNELKLSKQNAQTISKSATPSSIILSFGNIDSNNHHFLSKEGITLEVSGDFVKFDIKITNLENFEQTVEVTPILPWEKTKSAAKSKQLTVGKEQTGIISFEFKLPPDADVSKVLYLTFEGKIINGGRITPLVSAVNISMPGLKSGIAGAKEIIEIPCNKIENWEKNYGGKGTFELSVTPQQTLRFEGIFEEVGHHWFYPKYHLTKKIPNNAILMLRAKVIGNNIYSYVQLIDKSGNVYMSPMIISPDSKWHKVSLAANEFTGTSPAVVNKKLNSFEDIKILMIGSSLVNEKTSAFEISDLLFYTK